MACRPYVRSNHNLFSGVVENVGTHLVANVDGLAIPATAFLIARFGWETVGVIMIEDLLVEVEQGEESDIARVPV